MIAVGDGANDLSMMAEAGLSVAYRAKPATRAKANVGIDFSGLDAVLNLFDRFSVFPAGRPQPAAAMRSMEVTRVRLD